MTEPGLDWRISSYSNAGGSCVQVAATNDGVLVRNSNRIAAGALTLAPGAMAALVSACADGVYDDLIDR